MSKETEYLENKYPQMRGDKWNTHDVINDNWVAEMMTEYAEAKAKEAFEAARGIDYNGTNEYYFADYEDYKTTS